MGNTSEIGLDCVQDGYSGLGNYKPLITKKNGFEQSQVEQKF